TSSLCRTSRTASLERELRCHRVRFVRGSSSGGDGPDQLSAARLKDVWRRPGPDPRAIVRGFGECLRIPPRIVHSRRLENLNQKNSVTLHHHERDLCYLCQNSYTSSTATYSSPRLAAIRIAPVHVKTPGSTRRL